MASRSSGSTPNLSDSAVTIRTDSESYSQPESKTDSPSPPSSDSPLILYTPPNIWSILRGAAINLFLPFVNGLMLGFGELFAHEAAYRLGWSGTRVFPASRGSRRMGPGIEVQELPYEKRRQETELENLTSLE